MQIVADFPPNIDFIDSFFKCKAQPGVLYCYGDTIFNPDGKDIPPWLVAHEMVHERQQLDIGGPEVWWARYLSDVKFRFEQELAAHAVEFIAYCQTDYGHNRHQRRTYLTLISTRLASPLYGGIVKMAQARDLIKIEFNKFGHFNTGHSLPDVG